MKKIVSVVFIIFIISVYQVTEGNGHQREIIKTAFHTIQMRAGKYSCPYSHRCEWFWDWEPFDPASRGYHYDNEDKNNNNCSLIANNGSITRPYNISCSGFSNQTTTLNASELLFALSIALSAGIVVLVALMFGAVWKYFLSRKSLHNTEVESRAKFPVASKSNELSLNESVDSNGYLIPMKDQQQQQQLGNASGPPSDTSSIHIYDRVDEDIY